ncbi:MAG: type I polyketide synthase [Myxococcota bacterium]
MNSDTVETMSATRLALTVRRLRERAGGRLLNAEPIAIVGIGCRFPGGADDPDRYWSMLMEGTDAITEVPPDRWAIDDYYDDNPDAPGKINSRHGGFVTDPLGFDAEFFGISTREAQSLDPQHRLLLEVAWEALEDAGCVPEHLRGSRTGVYVGIMNDDYGRLQVERGLDPDIYSALGMIKSAASGRLSYVLGLRGPSFIVDTACSSSLVAVHLACESLRAETSDLALAGGVNLLLSPEGTLHLTRLRALAPDGRCKTFDAAANGFVRSEGCGLVVLERLSDALANGRRIHALIRGSAVNHDGPSSGLTVPSGPAQQEVIRAALSAAAVNPAQIGYLEAHGSGTSLGDPIEVDAAGAVLGAVPGRQRPLLLGSVKTNIGHLESAAGIAGLIKAALAVSRAELPPHLHLRQLNPHIDANANRIEIPTTPTPWPEPSERRLAGVSAFGLTGTNAHVILEAAPASPLPSPAPAPTATSSRPWLVPLSARNAAALEALARAYRSTLDNHPKEAPDDGSDPRPPLPDLASLASAAAHHRTHHPHRLAIVARDLTELRQQIDAFLASEQRPGLSAGAARPGPAPRVVFVFPGQGSQWAGMGRQLLANEPVFAESIARSESAIRRCTDWSLRTILDRGQVPETIDVLQPVLFAIQVGLAALWRSLGVEPDVVVGHSMGEVAAAHVAGALSLDDAATIICRRSRLLRRISGQGAMAVVELSMHEASAAIAGLDDQLSVAVSNGPRSTVLSGDPSALDRLLPSLEARGIFCRRVKVDVASHSPQVDPLRPDLLAALDSLTPRAATTAMWSTVTTAAVAGPELGPTYWVDNLRSPVRFGEVIDRLGAEPSVFVELSAHPILTNAIASSVSARAVTTGTLRRDEDEPACVMAAAGALYAAGRPLDWSKIHPERSPNARALAPLPRYPWQHEHFHFDGGSRPRPSAGHPLLGSSFDAAPSAPGAPSQRYFGTTLDLRRLSYLGDHRVHDTVIVPGSAYLEAGLAACGGMGAELLEVSFSEAFVLPTEQPREIQLVLTECTPRRFEIFGRRPGEPWVRHASGRSVEGNHPGEPDLRDLAAIEARCAETLTGPEHYRALTGRGLDYGPRFALVKSVRRRPAEAIATLQCDAALMAEASAYTVHPALLDGAFQVMSAAIGRDADDEATTYLPVALDRLRVWRSPRERELRVHVVSRPADPGYEADIEVLTPSGECVIEARGLRARPLARDARGHATEHHHFEIQWRPSTMPTAELPRRWLLLMDEGGVGESLRRALLDAGVQVAVAGPGASVTDGAFDPDDPEDHRRALHEPFGADPPHVVIHALGLDAPPDLDPEALRIAQSRGSHSLLHTVQALVRAGHRNPPRLVVLSRGAQPAAGTPVCPSQASVWGLARAIRHEHPELRCTCVDLDPRTSATPGSAWNPALLPALVGDEEDQIALRGEQRLVARLAPVDRPEGQLDAPAQERSFRLESQAPGTLDALALVERNTPPPGRGEIAVEVTAAGLNFMDVLMAMGAYPGQASGPLGLGGECAGRIVARGPGVESLEVGDRVVVAHPGAFARRIIVPTTAVATIPAGLDMELAATLPLVFMTALYGLEDLARLSAGERVLVHAATGGVGLAAIQVARRIGAEIYATAGSEQKRAHLRHLGIAHVSDSRSLAFAAEVREATGGEGVDVVLNSLSGEGIAAGMSLLRPYGRFIDLSKRDIYGGSGLDLSPFRRSLSFCAVDLAGMAVDRPSMFQALLHRTIARIGTGELEPLPVRTFGVARATEAFSYMAQAQHIGKIALSMKEAPQAMIRGTGPRLRPDATYLITGGLGGLGLRLAAWMVERGARHLALLGRSAPSSGAQQALAQLTEAGAQIHVMHVDVTCGDALEAALAQIDAKQPPLRGVVHAAAVLDDGTLLRQDATRFERVMAPKILGAAHLHRLTIDRVGDRSLDFFVMYSSAASLLGSPGQGSYAAANAFLDALAHHRRALGLPGLSINWGPWSQVGLAAQDGRTDRLAYQGIESFSPDEGVEAFGEALTSQTPQLGIMRLDPRRWAQSFPRVAASAYLCELRWEAGPDRASPVVDTLTQADPSQRVELMRAHVRTQVAHVLRTSPSRIDPGTPLGQIGMDSLTGLELRNRLEAQLGVALSATLIWAHPTIEAMSEHLLDKLELDAGPADPAGPAGTTGTAGPTGPTDPERDRKIDALEALSEDEAEALLLAKLEGLDDRHG